MTKSISSSPPPVRISEDDVDAMIAYLATLRPPPNPFLRADGSLSDAARRGKQVFESSQANCSSCHAGPLLTDGEIHDVGTRGENDRFRGYNTPSLLGVCNRVLLLHDGRAKSLEQLLTEHHRPSTVSGTKDLSDEQRRDLIEYLKSL